MAQGTEGAKTVSRGLTADLKATEERVAATMRRSGATASPDAARALDAWRAANRALAASDAPAPAGPR